MFPVRRSFKRGGILKKIPIIYIFGPDGSGKTTIAKKFAESLSNKNCKVVYRWMRFNHIISKLVNGIGRVTGLSEKIRYENVIVGYHYYYKSSLISWMYIIATLIDLSLVYPFKILWPLITGKIVIMDRFIYDIMVDLMIDTGIGNLPQRWPGKLLRKFLPRCSESFYLKVDINLIHERRPDTIYDNTHDKKYDLYKKLSRDFKLNTIDNSLSIETAISNILNKVTLK